MNVIQWKNGARQSGSAEEAYNELERIRSLEGGLTPASVVQHAMEKSSVLHPHFMWNKAKAAEKYWEEQARSLIRSIEVIYEEAPKAPTRAFTITSCQSVEAAPAKKVYQSMEEALRDPEMRQEILTNALRDAQSFKRKYSALSELAEVFTAIDRFIS